MLRGHCQTDSVLVSYKEYIRARQDLRDYRLLKVEHEKVKKENEKLKNELMSKKPIHDVDDFKRRILACNAEKDELNATIQYQQKFIHAQRNEIMEYRTKNYKLKKRVDNYNKGESLARFTIGTTIIVLGVVALVNEYMEDN